jgi:hypothetical protein
MQTRTGFAGGVTRAILRDPSDWLRRRHVRTSGRPRDSTLTNKPADPLTPQVFRLSFPT